jgi:hypothetical protein
MPPHNLQTRYITLRWHKDGQLATFYDGNQSIWWNESGIVIFHGTYHGGNLHNLHGPAYNGFGRKEYYLRGQLYSYDQWSVHPDVIDAAIGILPTPIAREIIAAFCRRVKSGAV